ncbi:MAG: deoxyribodipyrimidine photo-lyase [Bacteroidia bacterium]
MKTEVTVFWFRRDLRLNDNIGLTEALKGSLPVLPVFIFDEEILSDLEDKFDKRVDFIHQALEQLNKELNKFSSSLLVLQGKTKDVFNALTNDYHIRQVYCNTDYEPYAIQRDNNIKQLLEKKGIPFNSFKDQVIFHKDDIVKDDGSPYTVFTPYSKKWKENFFLSEFNAQNNDIKNNFFSSSFEFPCLEDIGFKKTEIKFKLPEMPDAEFLSKYSVDRNFPFLNGTSRLSTHLRFGTISIRELVNHCLNKSESWLNELIWREFYMMILYHFPHVVTNCFKMKYDNIKWENDELKFLAWREGKTGYPIVDAGMRELNHTGYMHNRVRMITASFLVKDLHVDWRWGEAYFAKKLLDFDLSANNGGWQWSAGTGCDAAPYFRIFNPIEQQKKFDPDFNYVKKWVKEFGTNNYPEPIVDHAEARKKTLALYKAVI